MILMLGQMQFLTLGDACPDGALSVPACQNIEKIPVCWLMLNRNPGI